MSLLQGLECVCTLSLVWDPSAHLLCGLKQRWAFFKVWSVCAPSPLCGLSLLHHSLCFLPEAAEPWEGLAHGSSHHSSWLLPSLLWGRTMSRLRLVLPLVQYWVGQCSSQGQLELRPSEWVCSEGWQMSFHPLPGREVAPCHSPESEGVMIRGSEARAFREWLLQRGWVATLAHGQVWICHSYSELCSALLSPPKKQWPQERHILSLSLSFLMQGLPWGLSGKESSCQCRRHGFYPWSGKIPHTTEQLSPCATNYWALEPGNRSSLNLSSLDSVLNKRSLRSEKPAHCN